jgi:TMEM151 family
MNQTPEFTVHWTEDEYFHIKKNDCCYDQAFLGLIFLLGIVGVIVASFVTHIYWILFGIVPFIAANTGETFCSNTYSLISQSMKHNLVMEKLDQLTKMKPQGSIYVTCFHEEQRTRTLEKKNDDGTTSYETEYYTEQVDTHQDHAIVPYRECVDSSNITECLKLLTSNQYCQVNIEVTSGFLDSESKSIFETMKSELIAKNKDFDIYCSCTGGFYLDLNMPHRILTYGSKDGSKPALLSMRTFLITSLLGFGWITRIMIHKRLFEANVKIVKNIKI